MSEIEFAEVKNEDEGAYLIIWKDGRSHHFLVSDVLEKMVTPAHSLEDDFAHFLTRTGLHRETPQVRAMLRQAYEDGGMRGTDAQFVADARRLAQMFLDGPENTPLDIAHMCALAEKLKEEE